MIYEFYEHKIVGKNTKNVIEHRVYGFEKINIDCLVKKFFSILIIK